MVRYLGERSSPEEQRQYEEHLRPQAYTCGLDKFMPLFDYVGSQEHLGPHTRMMLQGLNLWDDNGVEDWDTSKAFLQQPSMAGLRTYSDERAPMIYTEELLKAVKQVYKVDYDMIQSVGLVSDEPVFLRGCDYQGLVKPKII